MQFIQIRGSGDVYHYTVELAKRDDIDIIEAPDGSTPDTVKEALEKTREQLAREAELAAAEAEKAHAVRVAPRTQKVTKVTAPPAGLKITVAGAVAAKNAGEEPGTAEGGDGAGQ